MSLDFFDRGLVSGRKLVSGIAVVMGLLAEAAGLVICHPSDKVVHVGAAVKLEVETAEGGEIQWELNGEAIVGGEGRVLEIAEVAPGDAGVYRAMITLNGTSEYSGEARVTVNHSPAGELPRLVKDLTTRLASDGEPREGVIFKEKLYYLRNDLSDFWQIWVTDGTKSVDRKFFEIAEDAAGSSADDGWYWGQDGESMYFEAPHTTSRWLWRTDGESDPVPLMEVDLSGGIRTSAAAPQGFFFANDDEMWLTDGTVEGTRLLKEIGRVSTNEGGLVVLGEKVYFRARINRKTVMAVSDGTSEGTKALESGTGDELEFEGRSGQMLVVGEWLYFTCEERFYRTKGVSGEVDLLHPDLGSFGGVMGSIGDHVIFNVGGEGGFMSVGPEGLVKALSDEGLEGEPRGVFGNEGLGNRLIFNYSNALWATDGTVAGTGRIFEGEARMMKTVGDQLFLILRGNGTGWEPWITDGTAEGTRQIRDIREGAESSAFFGSGRHFLVGLNGKVLFAAHDGKRASLWESDGTDAGTRALIEPRVALTEGASITRGGGGNGLYFFHDGSGPDNLVATDGGSFGTETVVGSLFRAPNLYAGLEDAVLYVTDDELWRSDGTEEGTMKISDEDFTPVSLAGSPSQTFPKAYYLGFSPSDNERGLWESDGTAEGTRRVFTDSDLPGALIEELQRSSDGRFVFFRRSRVDFARDFFEPWAYDTMAGISRRLLVIEGSSGTGPRRMIEFDSRYWFLATTDTGVNLYRTDGSDSVLVREITPVKNSSMGALAGRSGIFIRENSNLFFSQGGDGELVKLGEFPSPRDLQVIGDLCFFRVEGEAGEQQLWVVGTEPGSGMMLKVMTPGGQDFRKQQFTSYNGLLYFDAYDEEHGLEMWVTDGTGEGTRLLTDAYPGSVGSSVEHHGVFQGRFYFSQNDGIHGEELRVIDDVGRLVIQSHPQSRTVREGGEGLLEVEAVGVNLSYQWYRGRSGDTSTALGTGASLIVENVTESGFYWCRVANEFEQIDSRACYFEVRSAFDFWVKSFFPGEDAESKDLSEDLDGDGNTLLAEFAFGGDPTRKEDLEGMSLRFEIRDGEAVIVGEMPRRRLANLEYEVQVSEDLENWRASENATVIGNPVDLGEGFELVEMEFAGSEGRYFRVLVRWDELF